MIICKECGAEIEDYRKLSLHIIKHKLSSKDYYDKYLKMPDEGVCWFAADRQSSIIFEKAILNGVVAPVKIKILHLERLYQMQ